MTSQPSPFCRSAGMLLAAALLLVGPALSPAPEARAAGANADAEPDRTVTIEAIAGMRYSKPRFRVAPGQQVRIILENTDEMMHNLVITEPGGRLAVVNAAMRLGAKGQEKDYIPDSKKILHATPVLNPGEDHTLDFTAPKKPGVYPYVCTFPGHGFVMYGAMYVRADEDLPPLAEDPNVPDNAVGKQPADTDETGIRVPEHRARVLREFLPDTGPASIAVHLPGGQNYVWDAGECRFRYAWTGRFLSLGYGNKIPYQKKDGPAKPLGDIYYRAEGDDHFPFRLGSRSADEPEVDFHGYKLVDTFPQFRYTIDGVEVRELIQLRPDGPGLVRHFEMDGIDRTVWFVERPKGEAEVTASAGQWKDGKLKLTPEQARSFSITIAAEQPTQAAAREAR